MTLITGEVEKPAAPGADDGKADASFLSFIAGDETGFEQLMGGPDMVPDSGVGHSNNNVDTPVAKVTLLSGMMDQQVAIMPADRSLILRDAESVLNVPPEKMTDAVQPDLRVGSLNISEKTSVGAPALQDTDAAQDALRQTKEASSVLPQMVASDKQTNAAISATIPNDAPKQVRQPATLATPQKDGGAFQHDVMPKTAAWPRPQMPVSTDPDVVPAHRANTVMQTVAETTQKAGAMANEITPGKRLGHAPGEATETKETHRGQPMPIPQAPKSAEISNTIVPPKVQMIAKPPNQQSAAVPSANTRLEPHVPQIVPVSIQAPVAPHLPNADLPVTISRPTVEFPTPHPVNTAKELAPDNTEMLKVQNPLRQNTPNRPASDMPNRIEPPQIQATTTAALQINLPSAAHPFAPLQPTVAVPQSPKRQTSEGQLPEPDVQPAKQTTVDALFQTTTPAAPPPLTPMADPAVAEGMRPEFTPELIPLETRAADSTTITRHDTITNRPEVGRHIAQQLVEIARQMPDRPVELTLNPDELGRVRLTFTMSDGGIHVAVLAERGETMDLLRRHIETLAQEFRNMGYKDVNFDFSRNGQGNSGNTDSNPDDPEGQTQTPTETQTLTPVQLSLEPSTGLDLRL
ncbi:MAG: flagellar hook-length control protein FliK [Marinosulfonomonas sp.]|nr:flagellar hook-length control protein FliK [Marinosulfonomonas sp.]